jgi:unsaturated chondroitin disaccharide hydrolase
MMWIFYEETGDAEWRELAESYSLRLEPRKDDRDVHDLGFIFYHGSYRRWYNVTLRDGDPDQSLEDVVIHAGRTLALRFNEKAGCLRSFRAPDSNFIDIMMNVPIIFYAGLMSRDPALVKIAESHCMTTRRTLVRGDGSTAHEGIFNVKTGEFLRQSTQQGYRADSCWSRGLAWSLYGFVCCYELTHEPIYLEVAQSNAAYWVSNVPGNGLAPWDFDAPGSGPVDTSASAIAAAGLLKLAGFATDEARRSSYTSHALVALKTLISEYLAEDEPGWEGILRGGVYHLHKKLGVDESVMWGDFFFVDALQKAMQLV